MQKLIKKAFAFLLAFAVAVSVITTGSLTSEAATTAPTVSYQVHVQTYGWKQGWVKNGKSAGTTGEAKRLEAIQIKVEGNKNLNIEYRTHIQSYGWEKTWAKNGAQSGTSGEAKRLEAIQIKLSGADASKYDVYYRVHAQSYGWLGWAKNGQPAGTAGQAKRLEAIQIQILPKGTLPSSGSLGCAFVDLGKTPSMTAAGAVNYSVHVQSYGDQKTVSDGAVAGTFSEAKRLEAIKISLDTKKLGISGLTGGITYRTHVQSYGWSQGWVSNGKSSGTSGQAKRLEAIEIKLTGAVANYYDVYYRVHAQTYGWLAWAKNGQTAGSAGSAKRLEGIQICLVPKGTAAPNALPATTTSAFVSTTEAGTKPAAEVKATSITAKMTKSATMSVGATDTVKVTFAPSNVTNKRVTYASSDATVASVDATGKVTAHKAGTATITVKATDGSKKAASVKVTVATALQKINAKATKMTMTVGTTTQASKFISFVPANATNKAVTYKSSDSKILTVDASGNVKAIARGVAQIIVTSKANAKIGTMIEVTVKDAYVTKVTVNDKADATLTFSGVGETLVDDLNTAVKECKDQLQALKGEDWTATCGDQTFTVIYDGTKLTYLQNGEDVTASIKTKVAGKTMTLTAPVTKGKASKVMEAAEAVQSKSKYANNKQLKAEITLTKTTAYKISDITVNSTYSTAKINGKTYKVFFKDGAMYVVGSVVKDAFFQEIATDGIAKVELVKQ